MADVLFSHVVHFLTADYPFASELQAFFMAYSGHLMIRRVHNNARQMNWFHAFMLGAVGSFGGSIFAPLLMGRPTGVLANELSVPILIVAYLLTYHTPFDIGYKFGNTFIFRLIATPFTSMFKTGGTVAFSTSAFYAFKDNASKLYSIPVVAPILYPTLLANMGLFFVKGFHDHLKNGMPWAFQNGLFAASFFHFFVHDEDGPIGTTLRAAVRLFPGIQMGLDDRTFAMVFIAVFMQVMGFLQFPELLGPSFSPFVSIRKVFERILVAVVLRPPYSKPVELTTNGKVWQGAVTDYTQPKKKKRSKKKSQ